MVKSKVSLQVQLYRVVVEKSTGSARWVTKPNHSWTNGPAERLNRTLKEATVQRYYKTHDQLRGRLADFAMAYNFACRLKTLLGVTLYEYSCKTWSKKPIDSLSIQPIRWRDQTPRLWTTETKRRHRAIAAHGQLGRPARTERAYRT